MAFFCRVFCETRHERKVDQRIELAYILRRVELNHRELTEGQSPWSIRQTAVYHKFNPNPNPSKSLITHSIPPSKMSKSTFLFIAPSQTLEGLLSKSLEL